jgi:hypothetical protein
MSQEKYTGMDLRQATIFGCRDGCWWQVDHGMPAGD